MELLSEPAEPQIKGMDGPGWSNSPAVEHAPDDVHHEVTASLNVEPGATNAKAVTEQTSPVVEPAKTPHKSTAKKG